MICENEALCTGSQTHYFVTLGLHFCTEVLHISLIDNAGGVALYSVVLCTLFSNYSSSKRYVVPTDGFQGTFTQNLSSVRTTYP